MKYLVQQYYAIIEEKVSTTTYTKLWITLQQNLGASYLDLKTERLSKIRRKHNCIYVFMVVDSHGGPGALGPWSQGPRAPGPWAPNINAEEAPLHIYIHTLPLLSKPYVSTSRRKHI